MTHQHWYGNMWRGPCDSMDNKQLCQISVGADRIREQTSYTCFLSFNPCS